MPYGKYKIVTGLFKNDFYFFLLNFWKHLLYFITSTKKRQDNFLFMQLYMGQSTEGYSIYKDYKFLLISLNRLYRNKKIYCSYTINTITAIISGRSWIQFHQGEHRSSVLHFLLIILSGFPSSMHDGI